ncbi:MAG: hypothetical protein WCG13_12160 [Burkholderiales bacterium]|jgi:hypothetical protein
MRTTIDLPDSLYRQLKAHAALRGVPMKEVVLAFVERGLRAPLEAAEPQPPAPRDLPTIRARALLPPEAFSNAGLFEVLEGSEPTDARPLVPGAHAQTPSPRR